MAAKQNGRSNLGTKSSTTKKNNGGSGKRKYQRKSSSNTKYTKEDIARSKLYHDEITLIVTLVLSLILLLSNFNLSGKVGEFINYLTFGIIGFIAYILPIFLFFGVAFYIANRGNKLAKRKLYLTIGLFITMSSLIQAMAESNRTLSLIELFKNSASKKNGGGIIGGLLCNLFYQLFGKYGTYIVIIAIMLILIMFITGKALISSLGSKSENYIEQLRERKIAYNKYSDEIDTEKIERRKARTVILKKQDNNTKDKKAIDSNGVLLNENQEQVNPNGEALKVKDNLFTSKAKRKDKAAKEDKFDMKEIKLEGDVAITEATADLGSQIFEDLLEEKFGNSNENTNVLDERPNIDEDIERLLKVASTDMEEYTVSVDGLFDDGSELSHSEVIKDDHLSEKDANKSTGKTVESKEKQEETRSVELDPISMDQKMIEKEYEFPPIDLLAKPKTNQKGMTEKDLKETAIKLQKTLESFGVRVSITNVSCGPSVTRYELQPEQGVKVSKITGLADDIKLNLAAADVRIEAPIPGKAAVGIEVPNKENSAVMFRELLDSKEFKNHPSDIAFAVGKDIGGQTIVTDIGKMPHLLIAGATGSGKSVCINTLIMSILYKAKPSDVRMIMVDPKVVELSVYNGIPHLLIPVVTDPKKASAALNWAVMEMTERYKKFADLGVRDIKGYNEKIKTVEEYQDERYQKLPQIVIIVDELADLMMVAPGEVEDAICRLAQMARAAGLHLIIATQRPSVNVITGLIKANIPSRIAFSVSSAIDSRTIIDGSGAEKLLGKGDMLFFPSGYPKPVRVQGAFVSDKEVSAVVEYLTTRNSTAQYNEEVANKITTATVGESNQNSTGSDRDDYFIEAGKFIIEKDKASIGMLQRVYKIGFNRAARIMDQLYEAGVVGPEEGTKPRKILMSLEEFEAYVDEYV